MRAGDVYNSDQGHEVQCEELPLEGMSQRDSDHHADAGDAIDSEQVPSDHYNYNESDFTNCTESLPSKSESGDKLCEIERGSGSAGFPMQRIKIWSGRKKFQYLQIQKVYITHQGFHCRGEGDPVGIMRGCGSGGKRDQKPSQSCQYSLK